MSNEIATYSMILSKLSLGNSGTECPTKTQILAINSLIIIDNASTYGANECVKIDDIRKKAETWNYYLTVSPTSMSFGAGGGSKSFTVSSYKRKVLDGVEQSGDTNVSLKSTTISGTGFSLSGTTVSASANEGTSNRTGTVTITQNESNKTATISLSQSGDTISSYGEWTISVSASPTSVSISGGTSTITASAKRTVHWASGDVTEETGNPTLSTNLGSLSSSSSPSTLTLGENTSTSSRTATIKATHGGKSATCTVTQEGKPQITFTATVAGKNIHTQSWDVPTTAKTVSVVLPFPSSWSTSDEFEVKLRHNGMGDGSWTGRIQTGTMANYDIKSSITIENNRDSSVTFTVEYWFKGMDYVFHMWPADNTSGVYTSGTQSVDLQIMSRFFKEQHPLKVQSQPKWCTAYISSSDGNGIYNIDLLIQSNPLTQSRTGTIVFEQEDSGMTTSFTVSQGGVTLKDNKLTITSLSYNTAFLFPAGITPVEGPNAYLSFMVPNTFTWKTSNGLAINGGTIYAGNVGNIYVRENNRYKLVKSFQLQTGDQTISF